MKTFEIQFNDFESLTDEEMKIFNGGYGYHASTAPGAEAVGKAFWGCVRTFISGFSDGYNDATRHKGNLR